VKAWRFPLFVSLLRFPPLLTFTVARFLSLFVYILCFADFYNSPTNRHRHDTESTHRLRQVLVLHLYGTFPTNRSSRLKSFHSINQVCIRHTSNHAWRQGQQNQWKAPKDFTRGQIYRTELGPGPKLCLHTWHHSRNQSEVWFDCS
jgi:hypothetical protein